MSNEKIKCDRTSGGFKMRWDYPFNTLVDGEQFESFDLAVAVIGYKVGRQLEVEDKLRVGKEAELALKEHGDAAGAFEFTEQVQGNAGFLSGLFDRGLENAETDAQAAAHAVVPVTRPGLLVWTPLLQPNW